MIAALVLAAAAASASPQQKTVPNWSGWTMSSPVFTTFTAPPTPPLPKDAFDDPARFCRAIVYFAELEGHKLQPQKPNDPNYASLMVSATNGTLSCLPDGSAKIERK